MDKLSYHHRIWSSSIGTWSREKCVTNILSPSLFVVWVPFQVPIFEVLKNVLPEYRHIQFVCSLFVWDTTLTRIILAWTYFRGCQNENFLRKSIFEDGQIFVISGGLIFAVDKFCIWRNCFSYLFLNKQEKRTRHENSIYFCTVYLQQILCLCLSL